MEKKTNVAPQATRKVTVRIHATRVATGECEGKIVLEVPHNATDAEVQEALADCADSLPEPDGWTWEEGWWLDAEIDVDEGFTPEVAGSAHPDDAVVASLLRDEDGTLVLDTPEE